MNDWYKQEEGEAGEPIKIKQEEGAPSKGAWIVAGSILLGGLIISASILSSGGAFQKGANVGSAQQPSGNPAPTAQQPAGQPSGPVKVSVDNDPVLGDKNAPLTLIEFSSPPWAT